MSWIPLASMVDLPKHNGAIRYLKAWSFYCNALYALVYALVPGIPLLLLARTMSKNANVPMAWLSIIAVLSLFYGIRRVRGEFLTSGFVFGSMAFFGLLGLGIGFFPSLTGDVVAQTLEKRLLFAAYGAGFGLAISAMLLFAEIGVAIFSFGASILNYIPYLIAKGVFHMAFPAWQGVTMLAPSGLGRMHWGNKKLFVMSPAMRMNGEAAAKGVPTFTYGELLNPSVVNDSMKQWAATPEDRARIEAATPGALAAAFGATAVSSAAFASSGTSDFSFSPPDAFGGINPANGMPLIDGGMIDVMGNPYGVDLGADHGGGQSFHEPANFDH